MNFHPQNDFCFVLVFILNYFLLIISPLFDQIHLIGKLFFSLLNRCHTVFLEQTSTWLMNGFLVDTFGEYVIRKSARKDDTNEESDSSILSAYRDVSIQIIIRCKIFYAQ